MNGGTPGHVVMVVDVAENSEGERCYLLAGGAMPAQDFHIVRNPKRPEDPWFYRSDLEGDSIQLDGVLQQISEVFNRNLLFRPVLPGETNHTRMGFPLLGRH